MVIEINNLNFSYKDNKIFRNLNLNIKEGSFVFISGASSCGKTTLLKILLGLIEVNSNIKVCGLEINKINLKEIRKNVGMVFENPDNYFVAETVKDEISFILENLNVEKKEIERKVLEISNKLEIDNLLNLETHSLSGGEKELVALASALVNNPKILLIDGSLNMLDDIKKDKVFKYLRKLNKENKTTIICTTENLEDSLYGKQLVLIKEKVILNEKINKAFNDENIFKKCNLELPFMALLSNKLKYYGLVDEIILDMDKMVNKLWK